MAAFLANWFAGFLEGGEKVQYQQSNQVLQELIGYVDDSQSSLLASGDGDPIGDWMSWGDFLRKEYGIEQFALVRWDD